MDLSRVSSHGAETIADANRQAAVVAPVLVRGGEDHVLFTKRADHLGEHPGQMSFPGGGREPSDEDLRETALREAYEEIGLLRDEVEFFGRLDDIGTVTDYSVTPFVARVPDRKYDPDEREVAEIAVLAESDLTNLDNYESEQRMHPKYGDHRIHFFHVDGYTVWGATGRMLVQLLELATDWEAPAEPDRVVDPDAELPL
ncbi:CoA pyrophosphatase [Halogeometricum sp. S1BR25-6]|uniref:CoA pyrophosphatase n=1 Tax=Halogeometricum salsisoli TaxID=2950536 RepID=A0ABU2GAY4_9EURY|nr:CoA pyrophosphatase [Halogeometricum sp. S1BR25-6]MDS0297950.1 CoA pyrophosphatase [Halogeometricum sp. S1BR25-6]